MYTHILQIIFLVKICRHWQCSWKVGDVEIEAYTDADWARRLCIDGPYQDIVHLWDVILLHGVARNY